MPRLIKAKEGGPRCTATSRKKKQCALEPEAGRQVCRLHGGAGGRPVTNGRRSMVPARLREAYEQSVSDAALLDLNAGIAVLQAHVIEAAERLEEGDTGSFRKEAHEQALVVATLATDAPEPIRKAVAALVDLCAAGVQHQRDFDRHFGLTERLQAKKEAANQIKLARQNVINAQDLIAILVRVLDVVRRASPSAELAERIAGAVEAEIVQCVPSSGRALEPKKLRA